MQQLWLVASEADFGQKVETNIQNSFWTSWVLANH